MNTTKLGYKNVISYQSKIPHAVMALNQFLPQEIARLIMQNFEISHLSALHKNLEHSIKKIKNFPFPNPDNIVKFYNGNDMGLDSLKLFLSNEDYEYLIENGHSSKLDHYFVLEKEKLMNRVEVVASVLTNRIGNYKYDMYEKHIKPILNDENLFIRLVKINGMLLTKAPPEIFLKCEVWMSAIKQNPKALCGLQSHARFKYTFFNCYKKEMIESVKTNDNAILLVDYLTKSQLNFFNQAILQRESILEQEHVVKEKFEFLIEALKHNKNAFTYAINTLREDFNIASKAVSQNIKIFDHLPNSMLTDKKFTYAVEKIKMTKLIENDPLAILLASPTLQADEDIRAAIIDKSTIKLKNFRDCSPADKNDRKTVFTYVSSSGHALHHASPSLRNDKQLVLYAIYKDAVCLQYASATLQNDKEVVLAAVQRFGFALKFASAELQNDKEIVLAAVKNYARAIEFASANLRDDQDIIDAFNEGNDT